MGVSVGPGRGSAAGSAVAYCIGITNVDPIKYDLLFERFLNPERAEEYYANCCRTEELEVWNYRLQEEKVDVLNIKLECSN